MKFATNALILSIVAFVGAALSSCEKEREQNRVVASEEEVAIEGARTRILRDAAIRNGLEPHEQLRVSVDRQKFDVGRLIFESKMMGLNGAISCRDCHLDRFGSGDGLPNAIGVGGSGEGAARMHSGGRILPRNALPFWGRGSKGFTTFFWDGKVRKVDDRIISQFGNASPSADPLEVAAHLPSVELREMVADTPDIREGSVFEEVDAAERIQAELATRFARDPQLGRMLAEANGIPVGSIKFGHVVEALAAFIRENFRIRSTPLERFAFDRGPISKSALNGGLLFYGRGKCVACHNGPYFSDLDFHAVAFPQAGFGKNGFGIDEGRYNVTLNPRDRFRFRTAPLHNVTKTAPYSHSGSVVRLSDAIIAHFDPLRLTDPARMSSMERADMYRRLGPASRETLPSMLTDEEVDDLVQFLRMLEF